MTPWSRIELAISIFKDRYGISHPFITEAQEVKGKIYNHLGEFGKEEKIWTGIINSNVHPENHPALATTYYNFAHYYLRQGEFAKAIEQLETSTSNYRKEPWKETPVLLWPPRSVGI